MVNDAAHLHGRHAVRHPVQRALAPLLAAMLAAFVGAVHAATVAPPLGALANATYVGVVDQPVTLRDGVWEGEPFAPGGASRPRVELAPGFRITGDLDGDGEPEAVVLLAVSGGGSGTFGYVAVAGWGAGRTAQVRAVAPLGDRVQIRYARIADGELLIDTVEAGEGDGACCPGDKRTRRWRLTTDGLAEGAAVTTGRLGPDDLGGGVTWRLTHLDRDRRVTASPAPTLGYADGRLAGFARCNRFFGTVAAGEAPGEVKIGPLGATRKACAPEAMALESDFLRHLEAAGRFGFLGGQLVMGYRDGERHGQLRFVAE